MAKATEDFKTLDGFRTEVAKGSLLAYHIKFEECRDKAKELFPYINIDASVLALEGAKDVNEFETEVEAIAPPSETNLSEIISTPSEATLADLPFDVAPPEATPIKAPNLANPSSKVTIS